MLAQAKRRVRLRLRPQPLALERGNQFDCRRVEYAKCPAQAPDQPGHCLKPRPCGWGFFASLLRARSLRSGDGHPSIARRPASVILTRVTSTSPPPAFMDWRCTLASPSRTRLASNSVVTPWAASKASVRPCGASARIPSALRRSGPRRGFRGAIEIMWPAGVRLGNIYARGARRCCFHAFHASRAARMIATQPNAAGNGGKRPHRSGRGGPAHALRTWASRPRLAAECPS